MKKKSVLIVDDEKNIRLTMAKSIESPRVEVRTAENGEQALQELRKSPCNLVFLDLKMSGLDGLEVLRRIRDQWPKLRVIIISAHGTIDGAVEAMKLGAADFLQKPFTLNQIRRVTTWVLDREGLDRENSADYRSLIELTKGHISEIRFHTARETVREAIAVDPGRPEAYNLLGALHELNKDQTEAQRFYRAALAIDPTYGPARDNLDRLTSLEKFDGIDLGQASTSAFGCPEQE